MKLTETEINELAARCEGTTSDQLSVYAEFGPSLLDTCLDLIRREKVLREALERIATLDPLDAMNATMRLEIGEPLFTDRETKLVAEAVEKACNPAVRIARYALAQVQDGGGKRVT